MRVKDLLAYVPVSIAFILLFPVCPGSRRSSLFVLLCLFGGSRLVFSHSVVLSSVLDLGVCLLC